MYSVRNMLLMHLYRISFSIVVKEHKDKFVFMKKFVYVIIISVLLTCVFAMAMYKITEETKTDRYRERPYAFVGIVVERF